jgi:hypothetical protein
MKKTITAVSLLIVCAAGLVAADPAQDEIQALRQQLAE